MKKNRAVTFRSSSVAETEAFGERLGCLAGHGQVIGLCGDLGAGKTALVRGLARGLGCTDRVHSPTFALLNQYAGGRLPLYHLDLYRLNSAADVHGAGLEDYLLKPDGVSVVEWMERWSESCEGRATTGAEWRIHLEVIDETTRRITHDVPGV